VISTSLSVPPDSIIAGTDPDRAERPKWLSPNPPQLVYNLFYRVSGV